MWALPSTGHSGAGQILRSCQARMGAFTCGAMGMDHEDHVNLLRAGVTARSGTWADFGSGTGAFTLALADLLTSDAVIYSIDVDARALRQQRRRLETRFPGMTVHTLTGDFTRPLDLPPLDGLVMANAMHFHQQKAPILAHAQRTLKADGVFILVEYNADRGNRWVPYPLSYPSWEALARESGFSRTELLATRPSSFLGEIYSAASWK